MDREEKEDAVPVRTSEAGWTGTLREGNGHMRLGGGAWEGPYTWSSRFEEAEGTNPEELIAAAHAGCFSMALAGNIVKAGATPGEIRTNARVHLERGEGGSSIAAIELECEASVDGIDDATFEQLLEQTKDTCPVSKALAAVPSITVSGKLT
jgi:lipoyl-dependent peroxiredoxin